MRKFQHHIVIMLGTFFYIGKIPGPGGTIGSFAVYVLAWPVLKFCAYPAADIVFLTVMILAFWASVYTGRNAVEVFGKPDPNCVVMDEVAGAALTLIAFPFSGKLLIPGIIGLFFVFRFFDIFKPLGIRRLEDVGKGYGIVLDDMGAGLGALAVVQLARFCLP